MYCSNCGEKASGNFCCHCGSRLQLPEARKDVPPLQIHVPAVQLHVPEVQLHTPPALPPAAHDDIPEVLPVPVAEWAQLVEYDVLVKIPEIKDRLARCASQASKGMTGEQFLEIYDKVFKPPVSAKKVAEIAAPLYNHIGIKTGKSQTGYVALPPGKAIVEVLCALARHGRAVKQVHQCSDGCIIQAVLPSDLWSLEGELVITLHRHGPGMLVEAATRIPGQFYDWGKSTRCLQGLFAELAAA